MNKTIQKTLLCATIAIFAQNSAALDNQAIFAGNKKAFMERVFFNEVKSAKKKGWKPVEATIKVALATASAAAGIHLLQTADKPKSRIIPYMTSFEIYDVLQTGIRWGLFVVPAAYIIDTFWYKDLVKNINDTANTTVLLDFINNWETNKQFTPDEYHAFFDALAATAQTETGKDQIAKNAGDIIEALQFNIQRTELKVSEVFKKGAFGKEDKDIYEVKPGFKLLKDFNPMDVSSVVDSLLNNKNK